MAELTQKQKYVTRKSLLWQERSSWMPHWQDISKYLLPRNGRFLQSERNKGDKRHNLIYDSTGTRAHRVLSAGLMAGMTSPARPWFRLATSDHDLMEFAPVKLWLNQVTVLMREIFQRSNTYRALHMLYDELGGFGTGASAVLPDFNDVVRLHNMTIGEYAIATDSRGEVNAVYREFEQTVGQMAEQYGPNKLSAAVKNLYDQNKLDAWVPVVHLVEPRIERDTRLRDPKNMAFASCYYEVGSNDSAFLKESGYKRFPVLAPRWAATGGDIYGNSPGMEALGDIKQLQHAQFRKGQGIDYMAKPPIQVPVALKNTELNNLPGGATYVDTSNGGGVKNLFDVNINLEHLLLDIVDVRGRIEDTFYKPLFMMISQDTRSGVTAREVAERHEEKLLMLGPVLERLHNELLKPFIDVVFDEMIRAGIVPPPPPEMSGQELNVEFISMLAQAQRAVGTASIDRFVMSLGQIAQFKPGVLDKFDEDEWADQYSDMLGIDPSLVVADDRVAIVRKQRAETQAAAAQQQQIAEAANTAATLASAKTSEPNALTDAIQQFSGYGGPGLPTAA